MCPLILHYFWAFCGHITSEAHRTTVRCHCEVIKYSPIEAESFCEQCHLGASQSLPLELREQKRTKFRLQMANYDEERHVQLAELWETRACRISEHHARHEEEHELCNVPPESITIVQADRLSTLISLCGLNFHELGMHKGQRRRWHRMARAFARTSPRFLQDLSFQALRIQAFSTESVLNRDTNELIYDKFLYGQPEEINLAIMERQILVWEQALVSQIRRLREMLREDVIIDLETRAQISRLAGLYFEWRERCEKNGPGVRPIVSLIRNVLSQFSCQWKKLLCTTATVRSLMRNMEVPMEIKKQRHLLCSHVVTCLVIYA